MTQLPQGFGMDQKSMIAKMFHGWGAKGRFPKVVGRRGVSKASSKKSADVQRSTMVDVTLTESVNRREEILLHDPTGKTTSASLLGEIINVIAHELSHQWFGNLVTPKWWTDLWLNEGFATYVGYLGSRESRKNWKWMQMFIVSEVQDVMRVDSLESSHPIYQEVFNPDQIVEMFDDISYGKGEINLEEDQARGSAIIWMMNNFLTEATFKKGLISYLKDKSFSNAETEDLWRYLDLAAHDDKSLPDDLSVSQIMNAWTRRTGFPVVTLTRDPKHNTATLTQARFFFQQSSTDQSSEQWFIPINFNAAIGDFKRTRASHWLRPNAPLTLTDKDLAASSLDSWIPDPAKNNWEYMKTLLNGGLVEFEKLEDIKPEYIDDATQLYKNVLIQARACKYNVGKCNSGASAQYQEWMTNYNEALPDKAMYNSLYFFQVHIYFPTSSYEYMKTLLNGGLVEFEKLEDIKPEYIDDATQLYKNVLIQARACKYNVGKCNSGASAQYQEWMTNYNEALPDKA
ncbi:unnamed protein product, partial [Notodromas monacha]